MARLCLPDGATRGIDIEGARFGGVTRYTAGADGTVTVTDRKHEKALRELGAFPANLGGPTGGGFQCGSCGFRTYFRVCSRCGGTCDKEQ
jgi:hypothetical protein